MLSPPETMFACLSEFRRIDATKSPRTEARAGTGMSVPRTRRREMRVTACLPAARPKRAARAGLENLYFISRGHAASGRESLFLIRISRFHRPFTVAVMDMQKSPFALHLQRTIISLV